MNKSLQAFAFLALLLAPPAFAAFEAVRLAPGEAIVMDGRFEEPAWVRAKPHDEFWDISPQDKVRARVATDVRFAYDAQALYVAIRAHDPDLSQLRDPFARRDNVFSDQDAVIVNIDPTGAKKFAHFFRANPRGVVADGLWNEDTGNEDFAPDFEVDVATGRFDGGWTAEFRIPFSSLRYTESKAPSFSVLIFRFQPREQRYRMASSALARDLPCFLCMNLPLTGLTDLPSARHLALTPQVTVRSSRDRVAGEPTRRDHEVVPSLDVKWRPSPDLVVDATLNPDFSQVELDTPQLAGNTQFALFFPEKRPFFLEGADILQSPLRAIYTRSIADPAWGTRLTQRTGKFDGTALVSQDGGGGLVLLPGAYGTGVAVSEGRSMASFMRGRWQVDGVSVGALATDRTLSSGRGFNRVAGPDLVWFANHENRLRAQVLQSWTTAQPNAEGTLSRGPETSGHAVVLDWGRNAAGSDNYLNFEDVAAGFRADNGFFGQTGYRRLYSETALKFRNLGFFNEIVPYLNAEYKVTRDGGDVLYQQNNLGVRFGLPRGTTVWTEFRPNNLVAVRPGGGLLKRDQFYLGIESNPFPWFSRFYSELAWGDRVDVANNRIGKGAFLTVQANVRPHDRAEIEYRIDNDFIDSRQPVEGPKRILTQRVQQMVAIWHLTARDSVRTIWQQGTVKRGASLWLDPVSSREKSDTLSVVYGHRRGIGLTFYVGVTVARSLDAGSGFKRHQGEVFAKGSWTVDLL